jgi:alkylhydroperoxidase/carboxymuconolactone decarboxylase family protein YurZ
VASTLGEQLADVVGRPGGEASLRCLALLHGASCIGRFDAVAILLPLARRLGADERRLHEAALQVVAYGGYPRAIEALTLLAAARAGQSTPPATSDADSAEPPAARGRGVWDAIYRGGADEVLATLERLAPGFSEWILRDAYGRILARPGLPLVERELLAVSALALMGLAAPLGSHVRGALRTGAAPDQVADILHTCRPLADASALAVLEQALDRLARGVYRA